MRMSLEYKPPDMVPISRNVILILWSSLDDNPDFAKCIVGIGSVVVFVPINHSFCITRLNKRTGKSETVNLLGNARLI